MASEVSGTGWTRRARSGLSSSCGFRRFLSAGSKGPGKHAYDVIIIGAGHNGLVCANYLGKQGLDVLVLENRHIEGGAAVTEEVFPGYKFSRASYLAGLLRPQILEELELHNSVHFIPRNPSSFTPVPPDKFGDGVDGLFLGWSGPDGDKKTWGSIAQFSQRDADQYFQYEEFLGKVRAVIQPVLDAIPPSQFAGLTGANTSMTWKELFFHCRTAVDIGKQFGVLSAAERRQLYELFTAPATHVLNRWFESEVLKATLVTDAVIGSMASPSECGSGYVLIHHVMGSVPGVSEGSWAYIRGGMGSLTQALANTAQQSESVEIVTGSRVSCILHEGDQAVGVRLTNGSEIAAHRALVSNATPWTTFVDLLQGDGANHPMPGDFMEYVKSADYSCGAMKINCVVDKLPSFACRPRSSNEQVPGPEHHGTIHFEYSMDQIERAAADAKLGRPASRPVIELTLPSTLDSTLVPDGSGHHIAQIFVQYAPYSLHSDLGPGWADPNFTDKFVRENVFGAIEELAPGFSSSVLHTDVLSPLRLEQEFGLHKGNIMHGALSLHQLAWGRPGYRTPMQGLYLCGSGAHPGGGVMGAAGRNCSRQILYDLGLDFP